MRDLPSLPVGYALAAIAVALWVISIIETIPGGL